MHPSEPETLLFTATNPPASVSATATLDGRVVRIELSPHVTELTEHELGEETTVIATLVRHQALSARHVLVAGYLADLGHDAVAVREFLEHDLDWPSPATVLAARAELFASRYPGYAR